MSGRVLIVDADDERRESLAQSLRREGFESECVPRGEAALERCARDPRPALVVADVDDLPDLPGLELVRRMRLERRTRDLRVIILSERADEVDRVVAFELGTDDYVVKPSSEREVVLRVRAILRRGELAPSGPKSPDVVRFGRIRVDVPGHRVWVDDREVHLTALEFRLFVTLLSRRGRVEDRQRLVRDLWGRQAEVTVRTVDTHVRHLRGKLGPAGAYIETVRGVGYRFVDHPDAR